VFICLCFASPRVGNILRDGSRALLNIHTGCGRSWLVLLSWWERQNEKSSLGISSSSDEAKTAGKNIKGMWAQASSLLRHSEALRMMQ